MSSQSIELQRARWWREGWRQAYNRAEAEDRLTVRIFNRELTAIMRFVRCLPKPMSGQTGGEQE